MAYELSNKYFIKTSPNGQWVDINESVDGVKVLSISGFNAIGEAINIYTEQWFGSQKEDFLVAGDTVIRKNVDLEMTFIVSTKYSVNKDIDVQTAYNDFINIIANHGDFYVSTEYYDSAAHVYCTGIKPTVEKLHRGVNSFILATATLHTLEAPKRQESTLSI